MELFKLSFVEENSCSTNVLSDQALRCPQQWFSKSCRLQTDENTHSFSDC